MQCPQNKLIYCRGGVLPPEEEDPVPPVPEELVVPLGFVVEGLIPGVALFGELRKAGPLIQGFALLAWFCAVVVVELLLELASAPAFGVAVLAPGVAVDAGGIAVLGHGVEVEGVVDGVVAAPGVVAPGVVFEVV
jgi:hypothetical protein